jgi:hypothetical protein
MKTIGTILFFSACLVAVTACGKSGNSGTAGSATVTNAAAPKGGSCNESKAGICTEYNDNPLGLAEGACKEMFKGTYNKGSCPTENTIGFCQKKDEKQFYYFGNGVGAWVDDAKEDCEKNQLTPGKFTATAGVDQAAKDKAIPPASAIQASCQKKDGSCDDITGRLGDLEKSLCEDPNLGGKWADGAACTADNLIGSCVQHGKVRRHYTSELKGGLTSVKGLTDDCQDGFTKGHWYPGPAAPAAKGGAATPPGAKAATPAVKGGAGKAKK